jgi:hypothetical protein
MPRYIDAYSILESLRIQSLSDAEILEWIITSYLSEPMAKAMMLSARDELLKE